MFDQVADAVVGLVPSELGPLRSQARRWGIKVWIDEPECPREHYEAQVIGAKHVPGAEVLVVEVGFHAEHPKPADNEDALAPIVAGEPQWRAELGEPTELGPFLGRDGWLRASETWIDPDLSDPELCFELADRLAAYVIAFEPLRSVPVATPPAMP